MIHNEGGLNQVLLAELFEEEVDDVALGVTLLEFYMMLLSKLLCLGIICNGIEINTGIFLDTINHGNAFEWLAKVDLNAIVCDYRGTADGLCQMLKHALGEFHHPLVIGVCLVQLHQGKLRIMSGIYALITEYTADFVYSLQSTHN